MSNQSEKADSVMDDENLKIDENQSDEEEEGDIFEVDFLMDMKMKKGVRYFYVRWKGYDETEDSWEPEENLEGSREILNRFLAEYKPKTKTGRPSKSGTTPKPSTSSKKRARSREPSKEEEAEEKSDSGDDDYGQSKRKKKKGNDEASTSKTPKSKIENYTSVPALNTAIKRKINSNLRWLEDDSDEKESDNEANQKLTATSTLTTLAPPKLDPDTTNEQNADEPVEKPKEKEKEKKKKKKSKKHSKDRERSSSPVESDRKVNNNNIAASTTSEAKLAFLGVFRPDRMDSNTKGELQFIVRNNATGVRSSMTLGEAYLSDPWHLCTYLASKIKFQANGEASVEVNGN